MRAVYVAIVVAALTACGARGVRISVPFDESQAQAMLEPGSNQITGSGLIRQMGGGIVTCAGGTVILMPVTEYARQWASHVYGTERDGYRPTKGRGITFIGADRFFEKTKTTNCDVAGRFSFADVADGEFYIITKINWTVQGQFGPEIQGGSVMKRITTKGGGKIEVVVAP